MRDELCFWGVGDGQCAFMLQALVDSYHQVGMAHDFHVFSDRLIDGAHTHLIDSLDTHSFLFKFSLLQSQVKHWSYRYFVYLDADTFFVRRPPPMLETMHRSPLHCFLESPLTGSAKKKKWWNCTPRNLVKLMRDCGVTSKTIYTLNSGCFLIQREAIDTVCNLALDFWKYAGSKGYQFPDEPAWAYAMHMLCDDPEKHLLSNYWDMWCSDWEGVFAGRLPDGKEWVFHDYMSGEPYHVNPAIIHALRSKEALIRRGAEKR
jgi:hypothetical protein